MKIVAASCCKLQQIKSQPVWADIRAMQPDVLLLLGDTVYLDHDRHQDPVELGAELAGLYQRQLAEPNFAALLADLNARGGDLVAIYDDHDFLGNNRYGGDASDALRSAARQAFIKAFAPPQTGTDVYRQLRRGPIEIFLLDERYYRSAPIVSQFDRDGVLGAQQWAWLETQFKASTAPFRLVASSTTVHTFGDESWEQYPAAFGRLRQLLAGVKGAFVLSGDVHRNAAYGDSGIVELVTSGVARNGLLFGAERQNFAILDFDPTGMRAQLRSLKKHGAFDLRLDLANWELP